MASSASSQPQQANVHKFLDQNYHPTGSILRLQDHTEFYATGNPRSKQGVVMIPDTLGWNSGRIRNIADYFGENGFFVVIPKLSGSTTEGESKGPSIFESSGIGDYMKGLTYDANLKPKLNSLTNFLKEEGVEKISL
jgi:dienelactone hydrolase